MRGPGFAVTLGEAGDPSDGCTLGAVAFGGAARPAGLDPRAPFLSLPLEVLAGVGVGGGEVGRAGPVERWTGARPPRFGRHDGLAYADDGAALFGVLDEADLPGAVRRDGIEAIARETYARVFALLADHPGARLVRVHNYLPRITASEHGVERYRAFNTGRFASFAANAASVAAAPAATGIGVPDDRFRLSFLALRSTARAVENPRQVSAYAYPPAYGPTSPTFSRATIVSDAPDGPALLLVSGTASIVGHATLHPGDAAAQADEIARNLDALVAQAAARSGRAPGQARLRAYVRHPADAGAAGRLAGWRGAGTVLALRAPLCRDDLLIEVEGIVALA